MDEYDFAKSSQTKGTWLDTPNGLSGRKDGLIGRNPTRLGYWLVAVISLVVSIVSAFGTILFPLFKHVLAGYVPVFAGFCAAVLLYKYRSTAVHILCDFLPKHQVVTFFVLIFGLTFLVRLPWILWPALPISDHLNYWGRAGRLIQGHGFGHGLQYPPGPSAYIVAIFFVFGVSTKAVAVANASLAAVTASLVYLLVRRVTEKAARLSSLLVAIWPTSAVYGASLGYENLLMPALASMLLAFDAVRKADRNATLRTYSLLVFLGIVSGIAALIHPPYILMPIVLAFGYFLSGLGIRQCLGKCVVMLSVSLLLIGPWTYRNYRTFNEFCLISANFGRVLLSSNSPTTDGIYEETDVTVPQHKLENPIEYDKRLERTAIGYIHDNPIRALGLSAKRVVYMWGTDTSALDYVLHDRPLQKQIMSAVCQGWWAAVVSLWLIWSVKTITRKTGFPAFLVVAGPWIFMKFGIHSVIEPLSRHHFELTPVLAIIAALALMEPEKGPRVLDNLDLSSKN